MLIVADDVDRTERELAAGELACLDCDGELRPWGHARRRWLRTRQGRRPLRPRRSCCRGCGRTHVLVPGVMLPRRADAVEIIGQALVASAAGEGHRTIAARLARPAATVRGWLRRFAARAEQTRQHATRWLIRLDVGVVRVEPGNDATPLQAALGCSRRRPPRPSGAWVGGRGRGGRSSRRCVRVGCWPTRAAPTRCDGELTASW